MIEQTSFIRRLALALGEPDAQRTGRVVRALGEEHAQAIFDGAEARAAHLGAQGPAGSSNGLLGDLFFQMVGEQAAPAQRAWIFAEPEPADWIDHPPPPLPRRPSMPIPRATAGKVGCFGFLAVAEHLLLGFMVLVAEAIGTAFTGLCANCPSSKTSQTSDDPYARPITWWLWLTALAAIVGCLVLVARSQSTHRWLLWVGALLLPFAWLVFVSVAL